MDSWSIAWQIASVLLAVLLAAWGFWGRTSAGWWCFTLATVPIAIVAFCAILRVGDMSTRMILGGLTGACVGACVFVGAIELLHVAAMAQATSSTSVEQKPMPSNSTPPVASATGDITTTNQSGGINNTGHLTINQEDTSVKRRMRDLLNSVDRKILYQVSQGHQRLNVRMQPFEFDQIQALISEDSSTSLVTVAAVGPVFSATINNGSLGTGQSGDQRNVALIISPEILR